MKEGIKLIISIIVFSISFALLLNTMIHLEDCFFDYFIIGITIMFTVAFGIGSAIGIVKYFDD